MFATGGIVYSLFYYMLCGLLFEHPRDLDKKKASHDNHGEVWILSKDKKEMMAAIMGVSDEGDVLYVFPKDYRSKLAAKSFRMKIEPWAEKAKSAAEYVIRVSFGTTLVASIILVFTAILAILASGGRFELFHNVCSDVPIPSNPIGDANFLADFHLQEYWDRDYYRRRPRQGNSEGMNFFESVFSFVFGDGDPNQGIEEERWKLVLSVLCFWCFVAFCVLYSFCLDEVSNA
ncbi:hypothetical protein Cgig2_003258 [Carnegiea gigantea]|uniref:Uncharacterized protein n=1 Tax=Carnegiea gigantea TaxID=171969 RepID=A0A9Q1JUX7_9CARY|nr:hypothetical protein Cgig2_003258 [Carnegiea gigantea]